MQPQSTSRSKLDRLFTKVPPFTRPLPFHALASEHVLTKLRTACATSAQVAFCLKWVNETMAKVKPVRRRLTAGMHREHSGLAAGELLNPSSRGEQGRRPSHTLVDMSRVAQAEQARTGKRVRVMSSFCAYDKCTAKSDYKSSGNQKRAPFKCFQCFDGQGAYYHVKCFFECHRN